MEPKIAALNDGKFVIAWTGEDSSNEGVYFRRFNADYTPIGTDTKVNTAEPNEQEKVDIAALQDGGFIIVF